MQQGSLSGTRYAQASPVRNEHQGKIQTRLLYTLLEIDRFG